MAVTLSGHLLRTTEPLSCAAARRLFALSASGTRIHRCRASARTGQRRGARAVARRVGCILGAPGEAGAQGRPVGTVAGS